MARPRYETEEDLKNERDTMEFAKSRIGMTRAFKLKPNEIDFALASNATTMRIEAWAEVKCRPDKPSGYVFTFARGDAYMISLAKIMQLENISVQTAMPAYLIVRDADRFVGIARVEQPAKYAIRWGGRSDRGDDMDAEPVCFIPAAHFSILPAPMPDDPDDDLIFG